MTARGDFVPPCWDRGPRVGEDGTLCILPAGHEGRHRAHESFGNVGWSRWSDDAPEPLQDDEQTHPGSESVPSPVVGEAPGGPGAGDGVSLSPLRGSGGIAVGGEPVCGDPCPPLTWTVNAAPTVCTFPPGHPPIINTDGTAWGHGVRDGRQRWTSVADLTRAEPSPGEASPADSPHPEPPASATHRPWRLGETWLAAGGRMATVVQAGTERLPFDQLGVRRSDDVLLFAADLVTAQTLVAERGDLLAELSGRPTQDAYDAACRALDRYRDESARLARILAELRAWLMAEREELLETEPDDDTYLGDSMRAKTLLAVLGQLDERNAP